MPDPLTLPGDIPGLLRRGSPVIECGCWAVVVETEDDCGRFRVYDGGAVGEASRADCALDLSDPTGLAHAVWWMLAAAESGDRFPDGAIKAMEEAKASEMAAIALNRPAPQSMVRALRRAILAIAGRDESR